MEEIEYLRADVEALKLIAAASFQSLKEPGLSIVQGNVETLRSLLAGRLLFSKMTDEQLAHLDAVVAAVTSPTSEPR